MYMADDNGPNSLAYVFTRGNTLIMGGTVIEGNPDPTPSPTEVEALLARCGQMVPQLKGIAPHTTYAGIRPCRHEVRLGLDPDKRIVHNYGHGGSGFTICWGCAQEAAQLVQQLI